MEHVDVLIVGAGISGIGAACHLRMKHPDLRFTILEGRDAIGGTWDLFRYPGIRSDSDMFTFGYSFKPWVADRDIASRDAILEYLEETVDEYDVRKDIRFSHRVLAVKWSSSTRRWVATVLREEDGATFELASDFLLTCTGYYNYAHGHLPKFEGLDRFEGVVAHPQHWPEDLDHAGKRVLVIGSGATAVTLVPTMAETAEHVTMLQRSPTYVFSRPGEDAIAKKLRELLPTNAAFKLTRAKNLVLGTIFVQLSRRRPDLVRGRLRQLALDSLGEDFDVDTHFSPRYNPWEQRLCLIPDDDLFNALREGDATIVTDTIDHFDEKGAVLSSGERVDVDIVVPATGLEIKFLGGMTVEVDGRSITPGELTSYRGMMFGGVPNYVHVVGYTSASWTLKADLTSEFLCRLIGKMRDEDYDMVVPRLPDRPMELRPIMDNLSSGYIQRAADRMPKQGDSGPWRNHDNYVRDLVAIKLAPLDDEALEFTPTRSAARPRRLAYAGKAAVVTGAASGIGAALARALAARGADLALIDVDEVGLEAVARDARSRGAEVSTHVVDMGDADAIREFAEELRETRGRVDLLFNNAGVAVGGMFEDVDPANFEWLMNINFYGVVRMTRALLPMLRASDDAHIANVSSVFGLVAPPGQTAYAASKFAVRGFTEALRRELEDTTVGVSTIHPGGVKTNIARNARVSEEIDPEMKEKRLRELEKAFITTPADAAEVILRGVERRKPRIMVGPDARVLEQVVRLLPVRNLEVVAKLLGWKRPPRRPAKVDEAADAARDAAGSAAPITA